ncbi:hypothetical protein KY289_016624 [Solanum tuberosum]|nr:hypothetical protein KY289_016624 [Solanum tuberosum]
MGLAGQISRLKKEERGWGRFGAVGIAGLQRFWASISGIVHVAGLLEKKRKTQGWGSFGIVLLYGVEVGC